MDAYGVFEGGGVKGAALAGCLAAAEDNEVRFRGLCGTSAGAIVAYLASMRFSGREMLELMREGPLHPTRMFDDEGQKLSVSTNALEQISRIAGSNTGIGSKLLRCLTMLPSIRRQLSYFGPGFGIYDGMRLKAALLQLAREKCSGITDDVTFEQLSRNECIPLKIIASDIRGRSVAKFHLGEDTVSPSVLTAIRCSTGYPFVFSAIDIEERRLVDGGLASNLPSFLFAAENQATRYPSLLFEITRASNGPANGILGFVQDLYETALEASDAIMADQIGAGGLRIPVVIPDHYTTFGIQLSADDISDLWRIGYVATNEALSKWERLNHARKAGSDIQRQLWTIYGDRKLFEPPLWALAKWCEARTNAKDVRAHVMLPTGRPNRSRIVTYYFHDREGDHDCELELDEYAGCTGRAYKARAIVAADLDDARTTYMEQWGLTVEQQAKIPKDRKSMLSVPILAWSREMRQPADQLPVLGVLSVDSSTPLGDTNWLKGDQVQRPVWQALTGWSDIISRLLRG